MKRTLTQSKSALWIGILKPTVLLFSLAASGILQARPATPNGGFALSAAYYDAHIQNSSRSYDRVPAVGLSGFYSLNSMHRLGLALIPVYAGPSQSQELQVDRGFLHLAPLTEWSFVWWFRYAVFAGPAMTVQNVSYMTRDQDEFLSAVQLSLLAGARLDYEINDWVDAGIQTTMVYRSLNQGIFDLFWGVHLNFNFRNPQGSL